MARPTVVAPSEAASTPRSRRSVASGQLALELPLGLPGLAIEPEWKAQQRALCESMGWQCLPSDANFFCARTDAPYPQRAARLRAEGIKLRDCASFGLPGHVRLGVLPPQSQQALKEAWTRAAASAEP